MMGPALIAPLFVVMGGFFTVIMGACTGVIDTPIDSHGAGDLDRLKKESEKEGY
jgi:hypothetical protein